MYRKENDHQYEVKENQIKKISMNLIDPNPDNKKVFTMDGIQRLADSIKKEGFSGAIEIFEKPDGRYEIASGHRRYEAMKLLQSETIPCVVLPYITDTDRARKLISYNVNSRVMTPLDYANMIEYYKTHVLDSDHFKGNVRAEVARVFGISESQVHRYTAIKKMIPELQKLALNPGFPFTAFTSASTLSQDDQTCLYNEINRYREAEPEIEISRTRIENMIHTIKEKKAREVEKSKRRNGEEHEDKPEMWGITKINQPNFKEEEYINLFDTRDDFKINEFNMINTLSMKEQLETIYEQIKEIDIADCKEKEKKGITKLLKAIVAKCNTIKDSI